jgi:Fe-S oxidoreductase
VALFAGCAQDFIYPEQLEAAVTLLAVHNVEVDFPLEQSCCGLPLETMGQRAVAAEVALQNAQAFDKPAPYDAVLTLCASCASHIRRAYPNLPVTGGDLARVRSFSGKIVDFSTFAHETLGLDGSSLVNKGEKVCYHSSCHLGRGLGVKEAPRALIQSTAEYIPSAEEDLCCGFGGTYSVKFPEISAQLLEKKLEGYAAAGASRLVVDCPGCVMQLRGGVVKKNLNLAVTHIAELLAENLKP